MVLWKTDAQDQDPTLSIHILRFWQPLSGGNTFIFPTQFCSLQVYLPLRVTPWVQASHSITSITQDFSPSHIPRTGASGAQTPF